jgi:ubiquinone/menaquinone biosynthesis C-methylase UbiE
LAEFPKQDVSKKTHWEKASETRMGKYLTQVETSFIMDFIDLSKANTVMDVGAEAGRFSQLSKGTSMETISLDINSYGLKRLKLKTKTINAIQADARKTPIEDRTFDVIFMIEVLDYIPELDEVLAECHRTLKPNAPLILSFGNKSSLKAKLREIKGKSYKHSYRKVTKALIEAGFSIKEKTGYNWLLFGRISENRMIPVLAKMERLFGLRRIPSLSPWVIIHATKMSLNLLK